MRVYESAEDYLEAILVIGRRRGTVRSIDIANELHFSKPSVSVAMKKLRERGHIEMDQASASADACRVEHDLSPETFEKLKEHIRRTIGETPGKAEK